MLPQIDAHGEAGRRAVDAAVRRRSTRSCPGLDPPGRHAELAGAAWRCRPTSAQFIDVINDLVAADVAAGADGRAGRRAVRAAHPRDAHARSATPAAAPVAPPPPRRRRTAPAPAAKKAPAKKRAGQEEGAGEEGTRPKKSAAERRQRRRSTPGVLSERDERRRHDRAGQRRAAHVDRRRRRPSPTSGGTKAERDAVAEHRREVAARDLADDLAVDERPRTRPAAGGGPRWRCRRGGGRRRASRSAVERVAAAERRLVPRHDPAQPGLQRRDARAELVAVQRQRRPRGAACRGRRARPASMPAPTIAAHRSAAASAGTAISTPRSPV